jgi:hypothetical protein
MSIAVLTQVYDEMRRLAIAGSVVASGDFRLKKLISPLEQAGAKAPVFAKAAEAVKAVVDGKEANSSTALLDLTTLVNAVLYTQGETGAPGEIQSIETTDLGAPTMQASARVLKPLLEALTTTGSGRLELIKDAFERGAFRDLRLVRPALEAIDDVYGEIGEFVAEKVLPIYGKAILPDLRAKYNLKGRAGHPRRLRLMHQLDPAGARELVKSALDGGSKEIKVIAIECLGSEPEDLSYLIELASAKAQEVRQAALRALSAVNHDDAVAILRKAISGKDLDLASDALRTSRNPKVLSSIIADAESELASLPKAKDKKEISKKAARISSLLNCLEGRDDKDSEAFILKVFGQRDALAKIKGDSTSGSDINGVVVRLMQQGTPALRSTLAEAHASLAAEELASSFYAARRALSAAKVFDMFSPYLTAKVDEKKKQRDPAYAKREAIIEEIGGHYYYWSSRDESEPPLDPRWLDVAVNLKNLSLVRQLGRPGHAGANKFLKESFDAILKKSKSLDECHEVVASMAFASHPDATDAFLAAFDKHSKKTDYYGYWFARLIVDLPKEALPRIEALLPTLPDRVADNMIGYIQQLREKK